jgi:hypothetical protein
MNGFRQIGKNTCLVSQYGTMQYLFEGNLWYASVYMLYINSVLVAP